MLVVVSGHRWQQKMTANYDAAQKVIDVNIDIQLLQSSFRRRNSYHTMKPIECERATRL